MTEINNINPILANSFHIGSICPYCQHQIALNQAIVLCEVCRSWQHGNCWTLNNGCGSYHCDKHIQAGTLKNTPEFIITNEEVERVKYVPVPVRRTSQETAKEFIPQKANQISKLAVVGFCITIFNLASIYSLYTGNIKFIAISALVSLSAIIISVIATVIINNGKRYGYFYALFGILVSASFIVICTARAYVLAYEKHNYDSELNTNFNIKESLPKDAELDRLPPERAKALRANVVIKNMEENILLISLGSGIVIKKNNNSIFLLTNKHVIKNGKSLMVTFYNGEVSEGHIEWEAPQNIDLAIISCTLLIHEKINPVQIASSLAGQAQAVFAVGNPMNLLWSYTEGVISSRRFQTYDDQEISIYQTQTPINQGNSGGGLYNQKGQLIGVNTWTQDKAITEALNFAISTNSIIAILKTQNKLTYFADISEEGEK